MFLKMNLFIFSRSIAILTSLLNNSAGLAARHIGDQSPKGVFYGWLQGPNESLGPLRSLQ